MSFSPLDEFWLRLGRGQISEYSEVHKFGTNASVGTSFVPISRGGIYQTPTAAAALELVSSDANDTSAGTGARTVTVIGLDSNWAEVSQVVTMNGTTAVALSTNLIRAYRMYVTTSGTYGTATAASHAGTITLQGSGGGATWLQIYPTNFPRGQSQCGVYTIPTGYTAVVYFHYLSVEANKPATVVFLQRPNADTVSAPYSGVRCAFELGGIQGYASLIDTATPQGPFVGPCDIGFMGRFDTGTGSISVEFEIILFAT